MPVPEGLVQGRDSPAAPQSAAVSAIALTRALTLAKDAAFFWRSRRFVARSSAVTFVALTRLDHAISALVDVLSKRQVVAERLLEDEDGFVNPGHVFVTAAVALRSGAESVFDELVERLESDAELLTPLVSALAWLEYGVVQPQVERLLASRVSPVVRLGLMAAVAHTVDPGVMLDRALKAEDPRLRGSALEAVGRLGVASLGPELRAAFEDEDATCRFWAAWSAVRFGDAAGISVLGRLAVNSGPFARRASDIALRALEPDRAVRAHARLLSTGNERLGVIAAGIIGDPTLADWLLDVMESTSLARPAAAAFCLMTGRDLRRDDLDADRPPGAHAPEAASAGASGPDGAPAQVAPYINDGSHADEGDDDLPWPDTTKLRRWWYDNHHGFASGTRYLSGLPIRQAEMVHVLRTGNQQQRAAAALELALLNPDAPLVDVTAPAHRQGGPWIGP